MSTRLAPTILRAAATQARIALKRKYTTWTGLSTLIWAPIMLGVLWFLRDTDFRDLAPAAGFVLAGFLAFGIIAGAVMGLAGETQQEREDGTLLRAKAVPHGMTGHLVAKLLEAPVDLVLPVLPLLLLGPLVVPGVLPTDAGSWLLLAMVFLLATASMLPWGAVLGSVFSNMVGLAMAMFAIYGLAAIAGLFFPITALPTWLQWVGQATPIYWIGLGVRRAVLPDSAAAVEIGGVWRTELVVLVLLGWAVVGLVLAWVTLRRMARRQSGSAVAAARERVMARGY